MIVSRSDGVMSINDIYIAFVLNFGEWPWSLHICVLYPLNSGQLSLFDISYKNKKPYPVLLMMLLLSQKM